MVVLLAITCDGKTNELDDDDATAAASAIVLTHRELCGRPQFHRAQSTPKESKGKRPEAFSLHFFFLSSVKIFSFECFAVAYILLNVLRVIIQIICA